MKSELLNLEECLPFEYSEGPTDRGSKIGGKPPVYPDDKFESPRQKYFGTIEFDDGWAVSIFYSFEIFGDDDEHDMISFNNQILRPSKLIHAVVHRTDVASDNATIPSEVTCHKIRFGTPKADRISGETEATPEPHSKVGGRSFVDNFPLVGASFEQLATDGYRQLMQFDTPNPSHYSFVEGFPWDPGWLHVFVRGNSPEDWEFAFIVQQ